MSVSENIKKKWQPIAKPAIISCKDCGEVFETQKSLRKHVSAVHKKMQKVNPIAGEQPAENGESSISIKMKQLFCRIFMSNINFNYLLVCCIRSD